MPYDDTFLELIGELAPDEYAYQEPRPGLRGLVMERAGFAKKRRRLPFKPLLVAAVLGATLLAAAAYYSVSDAFRGILQEHTTDGQSRPLSDMASVVDRSGILLGQTVEVQGVAITVNGVVGDANGFKILLDIADNTGAPLALEQIDGTLSQDDIRFRGIHMRTDETRGTASVFDPPPSYDLELGAGTGFTTAGDRIIDDNRTDSRTTMLITVETDTVEQLVGQTLYITFSDLMQFGRLRGEPVGMGKDDLYALATAFPPVKDSDFRQTGFYTNQDTGEVVNYYDFVNDSDLELPLAPGLPGYTVTNAAVWNGSLYLRGTAPRRNGYDHLLPNAELRNFETDTLLSFENDHVSALDNDTRRVRWEIQFPGVSSPEELRGYVLALEGGNENCLHPLRKGEWTFAIPLDFEDTTQVIPLDHGFSVEGFHMQAQELILSPYYMRLLCAVDSATYNAMMHIEDPIIINPDDPIEVGASAWESIDEYAVVTMKNGSVIHCPISGWGGGDGSMEIGFDLQVVIDPTQVESVAFGDLVLHPKIS